MLMSPPTFRPAACSILHVSMELRIPQLQSNRLITGQIAGPILSLMQTRYLLWRQLRRLPEPLIHLIIFSQRMAALLILRLAILLLRRAELLLLTAQTIRLRQAPVILPLPTVCIPRQVLQLRFQPQLPDLE